MSQASAFDLSPAGTMADQGPAAQACHCAVIAPPPKPERVDASNELHLLAWGFSSEGGQTFKLVEDPVWLASEAARLVAQGMDLEARDGADFTPLTVAIIRRKPELALALLRCGANPSPESDALSPLHLALDHGFVELAVELAQRGADLSQARSFWGTVIPARAAEALGALDRWSERQALSQATGEPIAPSAPRPTL